MTDFFGGLTGGNFRFTDARIGSKDGPLPTSLSGPEGINGDPDGKYNFNNSLLEGITPYAYGQGRMGADRNYQQIPNRKQFAIPPLWLPEPQADSTTSFQVSHSVDMGDVAFIVNVQYKHFLLMEGPHGHIEQFKDTTLPQWNVFCNICTVNYILAGLQNYICHRVTGSLCANNDHGWWKLMKAFGIDDSLNKLIPRWQTVKSEDQSTFLCFACKFILDQVIRINIIPIGICAMSEKQGGQHEVGLKPVQAAASFFTTLTVDGQNRDVVNIWRANDLSAGDFLIFELQIYPMSKINGNFVLNHYYKSTVAKAFQFHDYLKWGIFLIPCVKSCHDRCHDKFFNKSSYKVPRQLFGPSTDEFLLHPVGHWHIGQTYTKKAKFSDQPVPMNDTEMTRGQLLQINFAPVWKGMTFTVDAAKYWQAKKNYLLNSISTLNVFVTDAPSKGTNYCTVQKNAHSTQEPPTVQILEKGPNQESGRLFRNSGLTSENKMNLTNERTEMSTKMSTEMSTEMSTKMSTEMRTEMSTAMSSEISTKCDAFAGRTDKSKEKSIENEKTMARTITNKSASSWSFEEEMDKMLADAAEPTALGSRRLEKNSEKQGIKKAKNA